MLQQIGCRYCGKNKEWKANEPEPIWYVGKCDCDYHIVTTCDPKKVRNALKSTCYFCSVQCLAEYKIANNLPDFVAEPDIRLPDLHNEVEMTKDSKDGWTTARTTCMCGHGSVDVTVESDMTTPTLIFAYNVGRWDHESSLWNRIKLCCKFLFTGEIKLEEEFIFRGEAHIKALLDTIEYGIRKAKVINKIDK